MSEQATEQVAADTSSAGELNTGEVPAEDLLVEEVSIDGMCGVY